MKHSNTNKLENPTGQVTNYVEFCLSNTVRIGKEEIFDFSSNDQSETGGHFGGDEKLALDFVKYMRGEKPSVSCTELSDSINGHICVYAADKAMKESRVVEISEFYK